MALSVVWYSVPAVYVVLTVERYAHSAGSYQQSVMRKSWGLGTLISDWSFNIAASLEFWTWTRGGWWAPESQAIWLSILTAAVFLVGGLALMRWVRRSSDVRLSGESLAAWWAVLGVGFALLALSFPIYLLLDSARGLWRTQFLSGVGAGLVFTALIGLATQVLRREDLRTIAFLAIAGVIVFSGSLSAIQKGAFHRWIWERHRTAILEILRIAPSVKPDTVIVLANVPKNDDPFGHNMWLDLPLRLIYPGIPVAGVYFYADGTSSPGNNLKADGSEWKWDGTGFPPLVREAPIADTIIVDFDRSGRGRLEASMPAFVCRARCETGLYNPRAVITGTISPRTLRRYNIAGNF